ncbi:MAG: Ger(x)C family spore germination protein [Bacilli bacterium]
MKKIIIIFILLFSLGGCYDYTEMNDLALIVGIGVDYIDSSYVTTFEILNDSKKKESADISSYTVSASANNFADSFEAAANKTSKKAYYSHAKLLVISESIAKEHLKSISDYLIRSNYLRDNFKIVIGKNPEEILSSTTKNASVVTGSILKILQSNSFAGNGPIKKGFDDTMKDILDFGKDTEVYIVEKSLKGVELTSLGIFKDYKLVSVFNETDALIYNILINNTKKAIFTKEYDGKNFSLGLFEPNIKLDVTNNLIKVSGTVNSKIFDNSPNFNIKEMDVIKKLEQDFEDILNNKIELFIKNLQLNKSDILYFGKKYYMKTRIKEETLWETSNIESNINLRISKKGIIYEVDNAN